MCSRLNYPNPMMHSAMTWWFPVILAFWARWFIRCITIFFRYCRLQNWDANHMFILNLNLYLSAQSLSSWRQWLSKPSEAHSVELGFRWLLQPMHMQCTNMKKPNRCERILKSLNTFQLKISSSSLAKIVCIPLPDNHVLNFLSSWLYVLVSFHPGKQTLMYRIHAPL